MPLAPDLVSALAHVVATRVAADRGVEVSDLGLMTAPDREPSSWAVVILRWSNRRDQAGVVIGGDVPDDEVPPVVIARLDDAADWTAGVLAIPADDAGPALSYPLAHIRRCAERLARARAALRCAAPTGDDLVDRLRTCAVSHRLPILEAVRRWLLLRTADVASSTDGLTCEGRRIDIATDGNLLVDQVPHRVSDAVLLADGLVLRADRALQQEWPWLAIPPRTCSDPGTA